MLGGWEGNRGSLAEGSSLPPGFSAQRFFICNCFFVFLFIFGLVVD